MQRLVQRSNTLRYAFPTKENRLERFAQQLDDFLPMETYPIIDEKCVKLFNEFVLLKKQTGTLQEKAVYQQVNDYKAFVARALQKRPLTFMNASDFYLLKDGSRGSGGFESIGTMEEQAPLLLRDYQSYDEICLSSFIAVSSLTPTINDGSRNNLARFVELSQDSVYIAQVGARFERAGLMEWKHMIITPAQNTRENGYGENNDSNKLLQLFAEFYGCSSFLTWEEAKASEANGTNRVIRIHFNAYFDKIVYLSHMRIKARTFFAEANARGEKMGKKVMTHFVGLGLVLRICCLLAC